MNNPEVGRSPWQLEHFVVMKGESSPSGDGAAPAVLQIKCEQAPAEKNSLGLQKTFSAVVEELQIEERMEHRRPAFSKAAD